MSQDLLIVDNDKRITNGYKCPFPHIYTNPEMTKKESDREIEIKNKEFIRMMQLAPQQLSEYQGGRLT